MVSTIYIPTENLMKHFPLIIFFALEICWIIAVYKIGDWKHWRQYYPTILFFWCGDLIYNVVFYKKPLWLFENEVFTHHLTDLLCIFVVFTCTVLIYLPRFPKTFKRQAIYVAFWVILYSGIEWMFLQLGGITHHNGWNMGMSVFHNVYQFILLKIHHHRPIIAWLLSIILLVVIAAVYGVNIFS